MIKLLCLKLAVLLLLGCDLQPGKQGSVANDLETLPAAVKSVLPPKDTVPPVRSARVMDTSRPQTEIAQNFPYDIDLKTADGKIVNSKDILQPNGKPTVLLFWLTTCFPCKLEMAAIQKEFATWEKVADFNLFAISTDFEKNFPKFEKIVNESNWPWPAYNDVDRGFRKVLPGELNGLPQTFIFDQNGNIVYHKRRYVSGDEHALFEKIKEVAGVK